VVPAAARRIAAQTRRFYKKALRIAASPRRRVRLCCICMRKPCLLTFMPGEKIQDMSRDLLTGIFL
jgi:hypothetical protein